MWNRTTPKTTAPRRSSPGIQAPESRHLGTDAMTAGESSDCGKPISISNRYCVASHNAYCAKDSQSQIRGGHSVPTIIGEYPLSSRPAVVEVDLQTEYPNNRADNVSQTAKHDGQQQRVTVSK